MAENSKEIQKLKRNLISKVLDEERNKLLNQKSHQHRQRINSIIDKILEELPHED